MKQYAFVVTIYCVLVASPSITQAHDGHEHSHGSSSTALQTWTIQDSGAHIHGSFVSAQAGKAQVRRDDGKLVMFSINQLCPADQKWIESRQLDIHNWNEQSIKGAVLIHTTMPNNAVVDPPEIAAAFEPFAKLNALRYRQDNRFFYVESNGMPDHPMMIGIRAWQQQVPLPQLYTGANAWQIPLVPVPAKLPLSAKNRFLRGAIALAVNGIPIFNPLNNRGDDAYLFGELDEYGGHCGRADDYHYHLPPMHLEKQVGKGSILAYALDGYPIYGFDEPDGSKVVKLDSLNGHKDENGHYHYHATKTYPYLNGGFYGQVTERDGQVDPQPRAEPLRPALTPMRDAKITDFVESQPGSYRLTYDVRGKKGSVSYTLNKNGSAAFEFVDINGRSTSETFSPKRRGGGGNDRRPPDPNAPPQRLDPPQRPDPPQRTEQPQRPEQPNPRTDAKTEGTKEKTGLSKLTLISSSIDSKGNIGVECTCDGASMSPAIQWTNAPQGTKSFAVSLWHTAPDQEKSYWVLYNIPSTTTQIDKNAKGTGTVGSNDKRRTEYDPMCSKGPGVKKYHITIYALSSELKLAPANATRAALLTAIKNITLAENTLDFQYERSAKK